MFKYSIRQFWFVHTRENSYCAQFHVLLDDSQRKPECIDGRDSVREILRFEIERYKKVKSFFIPNAKPSECLSPDRSMS